MKILNNVTGTQESVPSEIEFNVDTVYVRNNIRIIKVMNERRGTINEFWCYDETQYDLKEYHEMVAKQVQDQQNTLIESLSYSVDLDMRLAMIEMGVL